ncbi:MAG: hypothetical protein WCL02_06725 [bacterium]
MDLTLKDYIANDSFIPQDIVSHYIQKAKQLHADYFSFVRFHDDYITSHLDEFATRPLRAAPIGIKDIILTQDYITSC